ncbi:MAG: hypothetical protein H0Z24_08710 [Thermosipho sp. (in: Bacteria)]|nr:hypothetical protein [Thermosipho sp. (in: thermotogales)]
MTFKYSGWQNKNNDGKFGFFPTSKQVVLAEMKLIDFSQISPDMPVPMCDFTGGTGDQLAWMYHYVMEQGVNPVAYYNEKTQERYEVAKKRYGNLPDFHLCNSDIFYYLRCCNTDGRKVDRNVMAVVRNNPPYTYIDRYGETVRSEPVFFLENDRYLVPGGIHIFELPLYQLLEQETLLKQICYRYEQVNVFKFPPGEFEKFKQVVVIGVKKKENFNDVKVAEQLRAKLKLNDIKTLDEVEGPIYKLTDEVVSRCKPVTVFRDGRVTDQTLTTGLNTVLDNLLENERKKKPVNKAQIIRKGGTPIIEPLIGHQAVKLSAGAFDGIRGNVLIAGGSQKVIEVHEVEEDDKIVITEVEKIVPFIEITNARGDILLKGN